MQENFEVRQKIRKSNVRIVVTYFVVGLYSVSSVIITIYLFCIGKIELGLGVFNGLATLAAGIAGFWFGSRGSGFPEVTSRVQPTTANQDGVSLIGQEFEQSRRPMHDVRDADGDNENSPKI